MVNNLGYVVAAFAVVWVGLFIYILFLASKERKLRRDLQSLLEAKKEQG
jgi:CcmD family protein